MGSNFILFIDVTKQFFSFYLFMLQWKSKFVVIKRFVNLLSIIGITSESSKIKTMRF